MNAVVRPQSDADADRAHGGNAPCWRDIPGSCCCQRCPGGERGGQTVRFAKLAGQYADNLELQLRLFKSGARGGSDTEELMFPVVSGLTDVDMRDVAAYYASLPWRWEAEPLGK